jgi:O-antigen/teichoic acid export membrane protein
MPVSAPPPRESRPSFVSAVAGTYLTNAFVAGLSLANVLITARALGPEGRGGLAFMTTMAMLTATLASLGVEEANGNLAGTQPGLRRALATNSVVIALVVGCSAAGLLLGLIEAFPSVGGDSTPALRWIAMAAIPILVLQVYLQFLVRADYGFRATNLAALVGPVLSVLANGILVVLDVITVETALATWVVAQGLGTLVLVWYVDRRLAGFGRPDFRLIRRATGFGIKAHLGRVMKTGNYRLDQWILGAMAGSRELGLYSVAVAWSEALFYLPEALGMVVRPDVVRATHADAGSRVAVVFRAAILLSIPFVIVLVVAAPILCVTVFGADFRGSVDDLRILAPGAFGIVALKLLGNALTARERPLLANVGVAVAFGTTIGLDVALIPIFGGAGAATASTVAYTVGGLVAVAVFTRAMHVRIGALLPRRQDLVRLVASLRALRDRDGHAVTKP